MNLLLDAWIPCTRDGQPEQASLSDLIHGAAELDLAEPELVAGVHVFFIGVIQCLATPADEDAWLQLYRTPPSRAALKEMFMAAQDAFETDGVARPVLQDPRLALEDGATICPIGELPITSPAENARKQNRDRFVKRDVLAETLSLEGAMLHLIAMQTFAVGGNHLYYCGSRGNAPINTIVTDTSFWRTIWRNVLTETEMEGFGWDQPRAREFPWMRDMSVQGNDKSGVTKQLSNRTRFGDGKMPASTPYFNFSRRILLNIEPATEAFLCPVTGRPTARVVGTYTRAKYGPKFLGWPSPLSPGRVLLDTSKLTETDFPRSFAAASLDGSFTQQLKSVGIIVENNAFVSHFEAEVVRRNRSSRAFLCGDKSINVWSFGFACTKSKIDGWVEYRTPVRICIDPEVLNREVAALYIAARDVRDKVKAALTPLDRAVFGRSSRRVETLWRQHAHRLEDLLRESVDWIGGVIGDVPAVVDELDDLCGMDTTVDTSAHIETIREAWMNELMRVADATFNDLVEGVSMRRAGRPYVAAIQGMARIRKKNPFAPPAANANDANAGAKDDAIIKEAA